MTPNQSEGEEQLQDWDVAVQEAEGTGAVKEPQQSQQPLVSPSCTPSHTSPQVPRSLMEAAMEVHVEEAELDAL